MPQAVPWPPEALPNSAEHRLTAVAGGEGPLGRASGFTRKPGEDEVFTCLYSFNVLFLL